MIHVQPPRFVRLLAIVLLAALFAGCSQPSGPQGPVTKAATAPPLSIIPAPAHIERMSGNVVIHDGAAVLVRSDNPKATAIAKQFVALVAKTRQLTLHVHAYEKTINRDGAIVIRLGDKVDAPDGEGYRLTAKDNHILVAARDPAGLYYGTTSLWQLLTADSSDAPKATIGEVDIKDSPRFAWRGMMLDSVRHFQTVPQVKKLIDWMSLHKLNVLHWHLTDDQGWRIEIPKYPKLTSIGACRKAIGPDAALTGSPNTPYCGYYTDDQIRDIVQYAAAHYITVVPEVDIPGHMQAAIAAYPWLGVTGERPAVSTDWGINVWLLKPNQRTLHFLHDVFDVVMNLFPSQYIHVGGDEAVKTQWESAPQVRAKMQKLGLKNMDELQGWFTTQVANYLTQHGRIAVGWDEALSGPIPQSMVIMSWHGVSGAIKAAEKGHNAVLAPSPRLYLDHLQSSAHDEPAGRPQVESLQDIYSFNPVPDQLTTAQAQHILGLQANLWAEYMPTFARAQHAIFPRMAAWAEVAWSPAETIDWDNFLARMPAQIAREKALGIDYADSAWEPRFQLSKEGDSIAVTLSNQVGQGQIRYTTDGSEPTADAAPYTQPLMLPASQTTTLLAATYADNGVQLAAPRARQISAQSLLTRNSDQLHTCSQSIVLRLEDDRPLDSARPIYKVNIADMCWQWKDAPLKDVKKVAVTVGNLPWNYKIPLALDRVVTHPQTSPYPALNIYLDYCAGQQIAHISLKKATTTKLQTTVTAALPELGGAHDLCFMITGNPMQSFWGIDTVRLIQ